MPGESLAFAALMMGAALPASAGDRPSRAPVPDALALLLMDDAPTSGTVVPLAPGFVLNGTRAWRERPVRSDLASFEVLDTSAAVAAPITDYRARAWWIAGTPAAPEVRSPVNEAMASFPRLQRPSRGVDARFVFRLDGRPESPAFSLGGGAGRLLDLIRYRGD